MLSGLPIPLTMFSSSAYEIYISVFLNMFLPRKPLDFVKSRRFFSLWDSGTDVTRSHAQMSAASYVILHRSISQTVNSPQGPKNAWQHDVSRIVSFDANLKIAQTGVRSRVLTRKKIVELIGALRQFRTNIGKISCN